MRKYQKIVSSSGCTEYNYPAGMTIEVRDDGQRFRITKWGFRWRGNTGGAYEDRYYLSRERGRRLLHAWREAKRAYLKGQWNHYMALCEINGLYPVQ